MSQLVKVSESVLHEVCLRPQFMPFLENSRGVWLHGLHVIFLSHDISSKRYEGGERREWRGWGEGEGERMRKQKEHAVRGKCNDG